MPLKLETGRGNDSDSNLTSVQVSGSDVDARTTSLSGHSSAGGRFPTKVTNAAGHVERLSHDLGLGLVTRHESPNGRVTDIEYDGLGHEVSRRGRGTARRPRRRAPAPWRGTSGRRRSRATRWGG